LAQRIQMTDFIVAAKHMCTYHAHVKNKRLPGKKNMVDRKGQQQFAC